MTALDPTHLSDAELDDLVAALVLEQRRRAVATGDVEALAEEAFATAFDRRGAAGEPLVVGRLLVCPGSVVAKSKHVHLSRFVAVGDEWVWQRGDCLHDEVRRGEGPAMRSVSIVPLADDVEFHVVSSKGPRGARRLVEAVSYRVHGGRPERVASRVPALAQGR